MLFQLVDCTLYYPDESADNDAMIRFFRTPCSKPGHGSSTGPEHAYMGTTLLSCEMEGS